MPPHVRSIAVLFLVAACGPTTTIGSGGDAGNGGHVDAGPPPPTGSITGTVWAPGNAIGQVPAGYEIPISHALVYVTDTPPTDIPDHVYCDRCEDHPSSAFTVSDAHGVFTLTGVAPGSHLLVLEKAQFRKVLTIDVPADTGLTIATADSTLPSRYDPANGMWIPKVAIATGDSDHVEDIFAKMGILGLGADGAVDPSSFLTSDRVELWGNPIDPPYAAYQKGTITDLFGNLATMEQYHIIFVPCNYESDVTPLQDPAVRKNITDYVAAGGKLYVTDWSAEWEDAAFPAFIAFDPSQDTTPAMAAANDINPGDGDFGGFAMHGQAVDPDLEAWLNGQKGPLVVPAGGADQDYPSTYSDGAVIDASDFIIEGSWDEIASLPTVNLGTDSMGQPVNVQAKTWITGDQQGAITPHTVTFEPSCGRVLYSVYHTAQKPHAYLVPQERVLLYLIMEIGVCNDGPIVN